jgi:hypothetical protein
MPFTSSTHRAPYHSPYGWNWNHYHYGYRYPFNHVIYVNSWWPYWGWPYWGLGYPYNWGFWPIFPDYPDSSDLQPPYVAPPSSYQPQSEQEPDPAETLRQQPNSAYRTPYINRAQPPAAPSAPVTVVFKDGRPPEKISNYLLTSKTLTVFDQPIRDIPIGEVDLDATVKVNRQAGVEFSLPVTQ